MSKKRGAVTLFIFLLLFWLILSSYIDVTTVIVGFFVSCMIVFYNYDLAFNRLEATRFTLRSIKHLFILAFVLIVNIIKSNFQVVKIVLSPSLPIRPGFQRIRQPLKKDLNRALYGNSITLTPGTLTVEMDDEGILVHGLICDQVKSIEGSSLEKAFINFEGGEKQ
ncbi:MAG: Na+/H+ antiporter subunit E [Acholeplasmataceae bacterium]|nr:Na+/H+ antiporter subunit E [Acholeplasmataceae bacterium]